MQEGWVGARQGWNGKGMVVFLAMKGQFIAKDLITGELLPFLVMRTTQGDYVPWLCSQTDAVAADWIVMSRSTFQRQVPQGHVDWHEKPGNVGMATSDSDFDAD